ncbi:RNA polymerase sigma factor [Ilumatobacter nonamiensis]|uniref:RNA polymerase sigma factor n=1 Tax=Ilumatobacter nonamiensis TaxID=467093 RepID=UPI0011D1B09D|nr:sigma-70 family RNA polymerase sigma factor [Ilumatobacter nonamiensis]
MTSEQFDDLEVMYVENAPDVFRYLARRVGRHLAEDLTAETFRNAIESASSFDASRGSYGGWLFGIATNLVRRHWEAESIHLRALVDTRTEWVSGIDHTGDIGEGVSQRVDAELDAAALLEAVGSLGDGDRDLLFLAGWERLSSREIAEALGIKSGTVRVRLHRIRQQLHDELNQEPDGPATQGEAQ